LARRVHPKGHIKLRYEESAEGETLPLSSLLDRLRPLLNEHPFPVYLVGGALRDALLGKISHDLDFVVPDKAISLAFRIADSLNAPAYVLDQERDIGRVVLTDEKTTLDFARFRGPDLGADLRFRDFTINAMAIPATARRVSSMIDPCGGVSDLSSRLVQQTHDRAIEDDPVRALRALRLALSLDFELTAETAQAVSQASPDLDKVSSERVRDELLKLLQTDAPHEAVSRMIQLGLLAVTLPEVSALEDIVQSAPHHEPVLAHTIAVLRWLAKVENAIVPEAAQVEPTLAAVQALFSDYATPLAAHLARDIDGGVDGRLLLRLAALFHDVGKRETQEVGEDGRIRFLGHETTGAMAAARRLRQLNLSNEAISHVKLIIAGHMRPLSLGNSQRPNTAGRRPVSRRAVYRFFRDTKIAGIDIGLISLADHLATYEGPGEGDQWQRLIGVIAELFHQYFKQYTKTVAPQSLVNGRDLMSELGLASGPEIGRLLRLIEEAQAAGELTTQDEAIQFARRIHRQL
jgi:putative nucleotidyltransferase with HDIG domain